MSIETDREVRVVINLRESEDLPGSLMKAYEQISWTNGDTPGLLGCELIRDIDETTNYILLTRWKSLDAFREWQFGPDHVDNPSQLRPFQDRTRGRHWAVYEISDAR